MTIYKIPVSVHYEGFLEIKADSLEDAIARARVKLEEGEKFSVVTDRKFDIEVGENNLTKTTTDDIITVGG